MQLLDYSALEHNALFFKNLLGCSKLCAVVKNNAYGHGIVHVARYLVNLVDCFAVGCIDEARQIDNLGKDVLILLPQDEAGTIVALRNGYILTLDSFATFNTIKSVSDKLGVKGRVHIKIDSGMSRLGFAKNDVEKLIYLLRNNDDIVVEGVYSHFYGENTLDCDKQYAVFVSCAELIEAALSKRLRKHIANSSGVLLSSDYRLDMARVGLGLYGYGNSNLMPVKTVTSKVISIKNVKAGDVVGYGAKFVADADTRVAVVDVGYAQGFARSLVGSHICVNNAKFKVIAVCMAMVIIDIGTANVNVGDIAILLGKGVNISNDTVSIYELLCNLK